MLAGDRLKCPGDLLVAAVVGVRFFAIQAQRLQYRAVVVGEQHRFGICDVLMYRPRRHHKGVLLAPIEPQAVDDRTPVAADDVVNRAAGVAMCLRVAALGQYLSKAGDGRHSWPPCRGVGVLKAYAVVGASFGLLGQRGKSIIRLSELVVDQRPGRLADRQPSN